MKRIVLTSNSEEALSKERRTIDVSEVQGTWAVDRPIESQLSADLRRVPVKEFCAKSANSSFVKVSKLSRIDPVSWLLFKSKFSGGKQIEHESV